MNFTKILNLFAKLSSLGLNFGILGHLFGNKTDHYFVNKTSYYFVKIN